MSNSIDANFLYLVVSVVILLIVYNILMTTKERIHEQNIIIETRKNLYEVPRDICELYISNLTKNVALLYKNLDKSRCKNLKKYLEKAHDDLKEFTQNVNIDINDVDLIRYDVIDKYDIFKDSDFSTEKEYINIIIDLEIILYMIRNAICPKKINLIALQHLMEELYKKSCSETISYDAKNNIIEGFAGDREELYDISGMDIINAIRPHAPGVYSKPSQLETALDGEQYANEEQTLTYGIAKPNKTKINRNNLVSQGFECSADYILTSKNSQPYMPFCDVNQLRSERKKLKGKTTDLTFNRSLRTDYDYLDN